MSVSCGFAWSPRTIFVLVCIVSVCFLIMPVRAAAPAIEWQKVLGGNDRDLGAGIRQTPDGGYILVGSVNSNNNGNVGPNHGTTDVWVVRLNRSGAIQWQRVLGGTGYDYGFGVDLTSDSGYILAGMTDSNSNGDVGANHGSSDVWVVKLNSAGTILWQKVLGGNAYDRGESIQQTGDGGYILTGTTESNNNGNVGANHGSSDVWVVKLNSAGTILWQKVLGGSDADEGYCIRQTKEGGYILVGETRSDNSGDVGANHGYSDIWAVKLNRTGAVQWQKVLGGNLYDRGYGIRQTTDGGYILAGYTGSSNSGDVGPNHGGDDFWVVKLNSAGTIQWQKVLGGTSGDHGRSIRQTTDGGYILTGHTASTSSGDVGPNHGSEDFWVVKLNRAGTIQWRMMLGGIERDGVYGSEILQTSDGGYILAGDTLSSRSGNVGLNHGNYDFWVVKLAGPPAPVVNGITPAAGIRSRLVTITNLSGANFLTGAQVFLNRTGCPLMTATNVTVVNARNITCTIRIPAAAPLGLRNVEVRNSDGKSGMMVNAFMVMAPAAPVVAALEPDSGQRGTLVSVTNLSGAGFVGTPLPSVRLSRGAEVIAGTNVTVVSTKRIACTFSLPALADPGAWNASVINGDNQIGMRTSAFTVTL